MFKTEELSYVSIEELIEESAEIIRLVVKKLYGSIAARAGVRVPPKIYINKEINDYPPAFYSAGAGLIMLNAIKLQNQDVEIIAFILAHEVYHHKQYEDGERFDAYIHASDSEEAYANQRVEQEANAFAASLFPDLKV